MTITFVEPNQRMDALDKANEVRTGIAQTKRAIRELPSAGGCEMVAFLLEHPSGNVKSMRVGAMLTAIDHVGWAKASKWLYMVGVRSADRPVGKLSDRQRLQLAGILRAWK